MEVNGILVPNYSTWVRFYGGLSKDINGSSRMTLGLFLLLKETPEEALSEAFSKALDAAFSVACAVSKSPLAFENAREASWPS